MAKELRLNNPTELKDWLQDKPAAWSHIIAIRIALRMLPMIGRAMKLEKKPRGNGYRAILVTSVFRACCLSWTVLKFPSRDVIAAAADAAADDGAGAGMGADAAAIYANTDAAYAAYAAYAAARAAAARAHADADAVRAVRAADAVGILKQIARDAAWLEAQGKADNSSHAARLAKQPLWDENAPPALQADWQSFKTSPFAADNRYQPWIRWYEAVAPFDPKTTPRDLFSDTLTQRIATQPNEWWKRPALDINTDIARWLAEETTSSPIKDATAKLAEAIDQLPDALESPEVFDWRDGRLEVLPPQALSEDDGVAQDYLEEAREKAEHLLDRLRRTNADPAITHAVKKLLDVLTDHASDLRPPRVDSCADTLRFLVETHNNDKDERELSPVVLAGLMDLSLTTRKLCSCLPMQWKREAAQLAESLPPDPTDTFQNLETVRHTAEESGVLGDSASETLATQSSAVTDQTIDPLRRKEIAKYLLIARDLMLKLLRASGAKASEMAEALAGLVKEAATAARPKLVQAMSEDMVKAYKLARGAAITGAGSVFVYATDAINRITQLPGFEELAQVVKWLLRLMS